MPSEALQWERLLEPCWTALLENGPFYIAIVSPEGRLLALNRTSGATPPAVFIGRPLSECVELSSGSLPELIARVLSQGRAEQVELPVRIGGGHAIRLELHLLPVIGDRGPIAGLILGRDVTESNRTALELRMSVNALHRAIDARERLEADVHDGIVQSLYGIGLHLEAARAGVPEGSEARAHLDRSIDQMKTTLTEIRRYILDGVTRAPPAGRWDDLLADTLRGMQVAGGPAIGLELDPGAADRVPPGAQSELGLIAREAVSNAVRHAGASRVFVRLSAHPDGVRLEIADDGNGLPRDRRTNGLGLSTIARRAAQVGAIVCFDSEPGRGTSVRVDLPTPGEDTSHG